MQPSARQQELERLFNARRGHAPHISISDDSHHVTEAMSSYYGSPTETENSALSPKSDPRPLSFISSPSDSKFTAAPKSSPASRRHGSIFDANANSPPRTTLASAESSEHTPISPKDEGNAETPLPKRMSSFGAENVNGSPPTLSRHNSTETAVQSFPLNDIDYESSPAAVAQELSNLQAIRRMSMNVDTADPDLPSFSSFGSVPSVAPGNSTREDDPSKLFWVPARLHPELAPREFKTFVEERVDKIRRRSGSEDALSPESLDRSGSEGGLRRKKSMLSQQIDTKGNYEDGAERLERKRSKGMIVEGHATIDNLQDLENLVNDPAQLVRRMSLDSTRVSEDSGVEESGDMPILPPVQAALKRSTRTTYRRGSLRKGERVPFSKRALNRQAGSDTEESSTQPSATETPEPPILGLTRVQTEPIPASTHLDESESVPISTVRRRRGIHGSVSTEADLLSTSLPPPTQPPEQPLPHAPQSYSQHQQSEPVPHRQHVEEEANSRQMQTTQTRQFHSRIASQGRTTAQLPGYNNTNPLPNIIETLPDGTKVPVGPLAGSAPSQFPERKSSFDQPRPAQRGGAHSRPLPGRQQAAPSSTLDDLSSHPTLLPGSGSTRTDALTMVPTFEDRKSDKKDGGRKSSWKWIFNDDDEKKAAKEEKKAAAAAAAADDTSIRSGKSSKLGKGQDKARLDLLQNSIDGTVPSRPRESLVLSREDIKLDDERKKESKKASESRKDKDSKETGLLSAIFGGKKKSSESDLKDKKRKSDRALSPEPPPRLLKPDIDYNWTRFSILEERAIYRMAHIKLANPRRALHSQVLLSNFMYSYLAKVQMMHPQMQIPASQQQKMAQEQQRQQQAQQQQQHQQQQQQQAQQKQGNGKDAQPAEYRDYQRWQEQQPRSESGSSGSSSQQAQHSRSSHDASHSSYDHDDHQGGYDSRSSDEHSEWPDYRNSNASSYGQPSTKTNGVDDRDRGDEGYSVASTHDYLGYPKDKQPFGSDSLWDDDEKSEELW